MVDFGGSYLLFLHATKSGELQMFEQNKLMDAMFKSLERANTYYKNYLISRKWFANKNKTIEKFTLSYSQLKEKCTQV